MQAVILAGGLGTRLSEETGLRPKPLVEIGEMPILWHIMKTYSHYGVNDFVILLGYKGYLIKEFFFNYLYHRSDILVNLSDQSVSVLGENREKWRVTLVDTGMETMTGGRLLRAEQYLNQEFFLTYGDGVADINIEALLKFHRKHGKLATVSAVKQAGRFGALLFDGGEDSTVTSFHEKPLGDGNYINGGYFVLDKRVLEYVEDDSTVLESEPLQGLTRDSQLVAKAHEGFWHPMDTIRDMQHLRDLWETNQAPWKVW